MKLLIVYDSVKERNIELLNLDNEKEIPRVMQFWKDKYEKILSDLRVVYVVVPEVTSLIENGAEESNLFESPWYEVSFDTLDFVR